QQRRGLWTRPDSASDRRERIRRAYAALRDSEAGSRRGGAATLHGAARMQRLCPAPAYFYRIECRQLLYGCIPRNAEWKGRARRQNALGGQAAACHVATWTAIPRS